MLVGHRTTDAWHHKPYLYTLTKDFKTSVMGPDLITGKSAVEDPISIYEEMVRFTAAFVIG